MTWRIRRHAVPARSLLGVAPGFAAEVFLDGLDLPLGWLGAGALVVYLEKRRDAVGVDGVVGRFGGGKQNVCTLGLDDGTHGGRLVPDRVVLERIDGLGHFLGHASLDYRCDCQESGGCHGWPYALESPNFPG